MMTEMLKVVFLISGRGGANFYKLHYFSILKMQISSKNMNKIDFSYFKFVQKVQLFVVIRLLKSIFLPLRDTTAE